MRVVVEPAGDVRQGDRPASAGALVAAPVAGVIDQHPPHGLGGGREEVPAALEPLVADQPQVRLVDEGRGLKRLPGRFGRHPRGGELPQLVVHERQQVGRGPAVAGRRRIEETGHSKHNG